MSAKIIDGKQIAADIREELKAEVTALKAQGVTPGLGVILVGDDPASNPMSARRKRPAETSASIRMTTGCRQIPHKRLCWRWWIV